VINSLKMAVVFLKEEKICYIRLSRSSGITLKVRIYADEKLTVLKRVWHIKVKGMTVMFHSNI